MDFKNLPKKDLDLYTELLFKKLESAEEIKDWAKLFLDMEIPVEITDTDSTSSPISAIWHVYNVFKTNSGDVNPGAIMLSCREGLKCGIKGTKILSEHGFKNIENIKIGDKVWTGFSWQKIDNTFDEGMKPALKVTLDGGWSATGTPIHRYWCLRDGKEQWIAGQDLDPKNDLICINVQTPFAKFEQPVDQEKYDIGYFLGLLIGDGCLTRLNIEKYFTLTNTDWSVKLFFKNFVEKQWPQVKVKENKNGIDQIVRGKEPCNQLKAWGLTSGYSWEKEIPQFAWDHIDAMKGFIAGVFDTDGSWAAPGDAFFAMTAGKLLDQMQIALTALGIESKVRHNKKLYGIQKHLVSRLSVGQHEATKFEKLGIIFKAKKAKKHLAPQIPNCKDSFPISHVDELLDLSSKYGYVQIRNRKIKKQRTDSINYYKSVTYSRVRNLCDWMQENYDAGFVSEEDFEIVKRYQKILLNKWKKFKVKKDSTKYFYDLSVENEPSYWSNGLISHNTFSASILECLLLLHFELEICHAAALEAQSAVGLKYLEKYLMTLDPLIKNAGWTNTTQNKRTIQYLTPTGNTPFIKIVICNPKGMNSLHANIIFLDELDLVDTASLNEARNIVGYSRGIYGMQVYLSTLKFSSGRMSEALESADEKGYKILRWNLIDVTERCPASRHRPDLPREDRYAAINLPLRQMSVDEHSVLPESERANYFLIKGAYAGCTTCPLLPICKTRLTLKPESATGGFYKPIVSTIQKFKDNPVEIAESQLLCWRPGTDGLVFPRFSDKVNEGNVLSVNEAYRQYMGFSTLQNISHDALVDTLIAKDIPMYVGVDWGWTNKTVMVVFAKMPNGEFWIIDTFAMSRLEFSDVLTQAMVFRDRYQPIKWICDTASPANIKAFRSNGMMCADFKKDVMGGISSVRSVILNANDERKLKILNTENNQQTIKALKKHSFKLDANGDSSGEPDGLVGISDICDSIRYVGQVLFPIKGPQRIMNTYVDPETQRRQEVDNSNASIMRSEIVKITGQAPSAVVSTKKKGGFKFTI